MGARFTVFGIVTENDAMPKPVNPEKGVGIDLGVLKITVPHR